MKTILSDIEIAQNVKPIHIDDIASSAHIPKDFIEQYGNYKAKIDLSIFKTLKNPNGKLVLVTAISPTPAGEGKTTTSVGLGDSLAKLGKKTVIALREPSLGPVFGIKGGATGGGHAQVIPMEDINLHFTGDFHAITSANNLLSAMIDNHIHQGNTLDLDIEKIIWKRCIDMNDRALRNATIAQGGKFNGTPRQDGFDITAASEVMAILCLATDLNDLKKRLGNILIGYSTDDKPIYARNINAHGAMTALLKDAIKPNLVQTLESTPTILHGGPFANIAHGCNSVIATNLALKLSDITVTEAGFGADLGAEKFLHIKCPNTGVYPNAIVLVATIRSLVYQGEKINDTGSKIENLKQGLPNLVHHIENITKVFKIPCVVALNLFPTDTADEIELVRQTCEKLDINMTLSQVHAKGSDGGIELAKEVVRLIDNNPKPEFTPLYSTKDSIIDKVTAVANKIYRANKVILTETASTQIEKIAKMGYAHLPICIAKTQYSFTDDQTKLGAPTDFDIMVKNVKLCSGAGFVVIQTGSIMTMPGLPKVPSAEKIDIDKNGQITGLF
ncbi:MAG: formate--tetrahydrofolate ligase [Firmicutes bacterium]|nr:formate--tetrahydrofolate ligase [Bacillota bacterium]